MSPDGQLFRFELVRHPDVRATRRLYAADGRLVRTLDSNPSYELKRLRFGPRERVQDPDQGRVPARSRAGPSAGSRHQQEAPGLVHDLRRAACADGL